MMIPWFIYSIEAKLVVSFLISCPVSRIRALSRIRHRKLWKQRNVECAALNFWPKCIKTSPLINRQFLIFLFLVLLLRRGWFTIATAITSANKSDDAWKYLNWIYVVVSVIYLHYIALRNLNEGFELWIISQNVISIFIRATNSSHN